MKNMMTTKGLKEIYTCGKVQNILQGMQAAFVDIGKKKNTFIHAQDIMPKIDITKNKQEVKNIKEIIKIGMPIMVQVKRDSTNKKGARVSTHISLTGRFAVLMPNTDIITVSKKIENENERKRLQKIVKSNIPDNMGAIIRTSAQGKNEELIEDIKSLYFKWEELKKKANENDDIPKLIYENDDITKKILLDLIDKKIDIIWVNTDEIKKNVETIISKMNIKDLPKIIKENDLLEKYEIEKQIEKTKKRIIWLKCGGFITIDKTEALTAIDVNSGKYIGKETLEQTVFTVNKEATEEIAKQLRLRDLDGIIIIDYIDMKKEENKERILNILEENLKKDRSKTQVLGFTKLNLLEMTRKHMYSNIEEK